jgi:LuxR family transcriptional regulator, activator of conjugal transfer of Ti plasmids
MSIDAALARESRTGISATEAPLRDYEAAGEAVVADRFSIPYRSSRRSGDAAATGLALSEALNEIATDHGAQGGIYVHFGHAIFAHEAVALMPERFVASTAAERRSFLNEEGIVLDRVTRRAMRAHTPFAWSFTSYENAGYADVQQSARLKARAFHGGIAIPVQDYAAGPAFINLFYGSFAFAGEAESVIATRSPELSYAAADFHQRARKELVAAVGDGAGVALTAREIESLRFAALGKTVNEIAEFLDIKPRTIEFHLKNAAEKLGAPNKLRAVVLAMRHGLIEA